MSWYSGAGELWTYSRLSYIRDLLPQKPKDWGYTSMAEPLPRRRKVMSMFSHQHWKSKTKPMFQYVNKWTSRNMCYVSARAAMGAGGETSLRTTRWNGFLHWSSSELHSHDQRASWASTWADNVLKCHTEAGEVHQTSDPQTCFGRSYFGTWPSSNHSLSILSVVHTANWPHFGISFD